MCLVNMQVESCERCQRNNKKLQKQAGVLHPIVVEPKVWHHVGMDLIGPLQETPQGNKYIVTLTDYFSKWAEAAALPDKCPVGVAKFIYSVRNTIIILLKLLQCIWYAGHVLLWMPKCADHRPGKRICEWSVCSAVLHHTYWALDHQCIPPSGIIIMS